MTTGTSTGTHEPLFLRAPDPHDLFTKEAAIARVPDDERKWPAHVLSELHKQLPFLSGYDVDLALNRIEPEAGYGLGYAMLRNKSQKAVAMEQIGKPANRIRIPLVITDRQLQPFHTFELGGACYPLTKERVEAAMMNPEIFDGTTRYTPGHPSLVDQLAPPFQQRGGFGLSSASATKTSSAPRGSWEAVFAKTAEAPAEHTKEARIYGRALHVAGPYNDTRWSDDFVDTPFHKEALALEVSESRSSIELAKKGVERAQERVKEAEFSAKIAGLEEKLLDWKYKNGNDVEKKAMADKLASCCRSARMEWSTHFSGSPFYKEAMLLERDEATREVERAKRDIVEETEWAQERSNRVARKELEAKVADWRVKNMGFDTGDAKTAAAPKRYQGGRGLPASRGIKGRAGIAKKGSVLAQISGTVNKSDFVRFEETFADPRVRPFVEKNATVRGALERLLAQPILEPAELMGLAKKAAAERTPNVIQIRPEGYGYRMKWAAAPDGMLPQEGVITAEEAKQMLPAPMLQTADQMGVATATDVPAEPDPLVEATPQPVTSFGMYKVYEAGTGRQIVGFVIPGLYDPITDMQAQQQAQQAAMAPPPAAAAPKKPASSSPSKPGDKKPSGSSEKKDGGKTVKVEVKDSGTAKRAGAPVPGAPAPAPAPAIFVNGGQYAMQTPIYGTLLNISFNLPSSTLLRGRGLFYKTDGATLFATVPFDIVSEVSIEGRRFFSAKTLQGQEIQLTLTQGMKKPYAMPGQTSPMSGMPGPVEVFIPADFKFLPLDNPIQLDAGQGNPMLPKQAEFLGTMGEIRAWREGCDLGGPVFAKIGGGKHDWVDGLFWLAAAGVPQDMGVDLLVKAADSGQVVRLFGLQALTPLEESVKRASAAAARDLAGLPRLPQRVNLLAEMAAITSVKEASSLVDISSVDNVLALNFINPENVATFLENLPQLEEASCKLAGLVLATQLGLQSVPKTAAVRAMFALENVITGLKGLQTYSL